MAILRLVVARFSRAARTLRAPPRDVLLLSVLLRAALPPELVFGLAVLTRR